MRIDSASMVAIDRLASTLHRLRVISSHTYRQFLGDISNIAWKEMYCKLWQEEPTIDDALSDLDSRLREKGPPRREVE